MFPLQSLSFQGNGAKARKDIKLNSHAPKNNQTISPPFHFSGFLSAVVDRFGWWGATVSVWGNWNNFLDYTRLINPWLPSESTERNVGGT
jgi:hypothetical protein